MYKKAYSQLVNNRRKDYDMITSYHKTTKKASSLSLSIKRLKPRTSGFTIVELLIVIVVIGILAAISIVAYNGISDNARFSAMRSDLASLNKAIQLYYAENGSYPVTPDSGTGCRNGNWCGWDQATGDGFIPGIVPQYISATPQLSAANASGDTYLYRSPDGRNYKLIRFKQNGLAANEYAKMQDLMAASCGSSDRWGYWSSSASMCW